MNKWILQTTVNGNTLIEYGDLSGWEIMLFGCFLVLVVS